jgi:hypothetical protein
LSNNTLPTNVFGSPHGCQQEFREIIIGADRLLGGLCAAFKQEITQEMYSFTVEAMCFDLKIPKTSCPEWQDPNFEEALFFSFPSKSTGFNPSDNETRSSYFDGGCDSYGPEQGRVEVQRETKNKAKKPSNPLHNTSVLPFQLNVQDHKIVYSSFPNNASEIPVCTNRRTNIVKIGQYPLNI